MQDTHPVIGQEVAYFGEEFVIVRLAHVLEHAYRYDSIVGPGLVAIIFQLEAASILKIHLGASLLAQLVLLDREGDAGYVTARFMSKIEAKTSPTGSDVEGLQARTIYIKL